MKLHQLEILAAMQGRFEHFSRLGGNLGKSGKVVLRHYLDDRILSELSEENVAQDLIKKYQPCLNRLNNMERKIN